MNWSYTDAADASMTEESIPFNLSQSAPIPRDLDSFSNYQGASTQMSFDRGYHNYVPPHPHAPSGAVDRTLIHVDPYGDERTIWSSETAVIRPALHGPPDYANNQQFVWDGPTVYSPRSFLAAMEAFLKDLPALEGANPVVHEWETNSDSPVSTEDGSPSGGDSSSLFLLPMAASTSLALRPRAGKFKYLLRALAKLVSLYKKSHASNPSPQAAWYTIDQQGTTYHSHAMVAAPQPHRPIAISVIERTPSTVVVGQKRRRGREEGAVKKMRTRCQESKFFCMACPPVTGFTSKTALTRHLADKHPTSSVAQPALECPACRRQYADRTSVSRHIKQKHPERVSAVVRRGGRRSSRIE